MSLAIPKELIVETDLLATACNRKRLGLKMTRRIVRLECGHRAIARNSKAMVCPRCAEMLRRSIESGDEDYVAFRHGKGLDQMEWPGDRCRMLNEPGYAKACAKSTWRERKQMPVSGEQSA